VPTASIDGTELYYERAGKGEPLLLIQGMSATHLAWGTPFASRLEESFECIVFDNRGIGRSGPVEGPFTIAEMAADTAGLLDELGLESVHVLGISMGGMIAQELALAQPDRLRSLTLGCTYCGGPGARMMSGDDTKLLFEAMASREQERVFRAMWELNLSPEFRSEESRYADFTAMAAALPARNATIQLQIQAILGHDTSARIGAIETPTQILHGDLDRILPVDNGRDIASRMPTARLEILEGIGHMFWWEQSERSAELVGAHALANRPG
jgi:pimeloyl-ACP methyl ester carboxylesterase